MDHVEHIEEQSSIPDWLTNTNETAVTLIRINKLLSAEIALRKLLHLAPQHVEVWTNLGACLWNQRRYDEALDAIKNALALDPKYSKALANLGLIYACMRKYDLAERAFDEALEYDPTYLDARWDRSLLYLAMGDYKRGFVEYDTRIERQRHMTYPHLGDIPMWRGENLKGKSVLVEIEQGIGDTILFSRFLPWLSSQADKVLFCTDQKLTSLLWYYKDYVEFYPPRVPLPDVDYYAYLASIPRWYGVTTPDEVPPDPGLILKRVVTENDIRLQEGPIQPSLKVGICWTGNFINERNDERSVPFPLVASLAENPCVSLYSLQANEGADEIKKYEVSSHIFDLRSRLLERGYTGTCEVILQCDLVITCCTSVAHMAGALGVPTWIMLCHDPYWVWGHSDREDSPWYPSVRLFRQEKPYEWKPVVDRIKSELSSLVQKRFANG